MQHQTNPGGGGGVDVSAGAGLCASRLSEEQLMAAYDHAREYPQLEARVAPFLVFRRGASEKD